MLMVRASLNWARVDDMANTHLDDDFAAAK